MHYWPKSAKESSINFDTRTATCSIAVNAAAEDNGCLWVLPGSHKAGDLYPGCLTKSAGSRPVAGGVIELEVLPEDVPKRVFLPLAAGDMSVRRGTWGGALPSGLMCLSCLCADPRGVDRPRVWRERV